MPASHALTPQSAARDRRPGIGLAPFPEYIPTVKVRQLRRCVCVCVCMFMLPGSPTLLVPQEQSSKEKLETLKQQRSKIIGPAFIPNAYNKSMLTKSIITHPMNIASLYTP